MSYYLHISFRISIFLSVNLCMVVMFTGGLVAGVYVCTGVCCLRVCLVLTQVGQNPASL